MSEATMKNLRFVRLRVPSLIPSHLIEAVKGNLFTPQQFCEYQEKQIGNPYNLLYALISEDHKIQGFLWAEINAMDKALFINTYSVNKEYWGKGAAIPLAVKFLHQVKEKFDCPRVFWFTTNEKFFSKHGFKKSKNVLMEYSESDKSVEKEAPDGTI
jgi:hypothetical protein